MTDALERIKQRGQRPSVPSRDVSLTATREAITPEVKIPEYADTSISGYPGNKVLELVEPPELDTRARSLRLESEVLERVQAACREHNVSLDVMVEALFLQSEANPLVWGAVIEEAQRRNKIRKEIANQRRVASQVKKLNVG